MIDRYGSILSEVKHTNRGGYTINGKDSIAAFLDDYIYILNIVLDYVDRELSREPELRKKFNEDTAKKFALKLAYGYFMYGYKNYFVTKDKDSADYILNLNVTASLKSLTDKDPIFWSDARSTQLGHYFRCIFYIVKFVASQNWLSEEEKYNYVKQLRSLMSDKEQILLYYNVLSVLGKPWINPLGETKVEKMCYMARFRMIKNIPYYYEYVGINPKALFFTEYSAYNKMGKKFFEIDLKEQKSFSFVAFATESK